MTGVLQSLGEYETLRAEASEIARVQNVDIIKSPDNDDDTLALCHVAFLQPLSRVYPEEREIEFEDELENIAAAMLAMEHFNTGNGTITPEVEGINQRCNIRFTSEIFDTEHSESTAVEHVIDITSRSANYTQDNRTPLPCVFLGSTRSSVCIPTGIITGIKGYPQFSAECTSPQLNNADQFPLFGRLINSDDGTANPMLKWLHQQARVDNLAILYRDDNYGINYARSVQIRAKESFPDMNIEMIVIPYSGITDQDYDRVIAQISDTKFRYIFAIISRSKHYDTLMTKAYEAGIAGNGDHVWLFSDSLGTKLLSRDYETGSPLHLATRGIGVITPVGGMPGDSLYDSYSAAMEELDNDSDLDFLRSKFPTFPDVDPEVYQETMAELRLGRPTETLGPLNYDTIMAFGLAACAASEPPLYFDGATHFEKMVQNNFQGVSGSIVLDPVTGSRDPESALFNVINFVEKEDSAGNVTNFAGVVSDLFQNGSWVTLEPYVFNDGSTLAPLVLPPQQLDYNFIGTPLRALGVTLSAIVLCLSLGFALWTSANRSSRVVKSSQPIFLGLVCLGTFLMGAAIIPLSIDDEIASVQGCTIACMATWWLLGIGFPIAYTALFTKTYRIYRVIKAAKKFQRVTLDVKDVILPMMLFIGFNALILTVFTIHSPLVWSREVIALDEFGRPRESYGGCFSDGATPYVATAGVVNFGCLVIGGYLAYKARHLSTDFAESEYIAMAMSLFFVVGLIAVPVVILAEENPGAYFFVIAALIFVTSGSLLLLIFIPKVRSVKMKSPTGVLKSSRKSAAPSGTSEFRPSDFGNSMTEVGMGIHDTDQLLPRIMSENKILKDQTTALLKRIRQLESQGDINASMPDVLKPPTRMNSREPSENGLQVVDKRSQLETAQEEAKELQSLKQELTVRLMNLERQKGQKKLELSDILDVDEVTDEPEDAEDAEDAEDDGLL